MFIETVNLKSRFVCETEQHSPSAQREIVNRLVHIFSQFAAIQRMKEFGFLGQDIDQALREIGHQARQRHRGWAGDATRRWRRLEARLEGVLRALPNNTRIICQVSYIVAHHGVDLPLRGDPADPFAASIE